MIFYIYNSHVIALKKSLQQKDKNKMGWEYKKPLKTQKILQLSESHILMYSHLLLGFKEAELLIKSLNCTIILDNGTFKTNSYVSQLKLRAKSKN